MSDPARPPVDFVLLGHPDSYEHLGELVVHSRPDYGRGRLARHQATLEKLFEWTPSYASESTLYVPSAERPRASGRLVICTFLPGSLRSPQQIADGGTEDTQRVRAHETSGRGWWAWGASPRSWAAPRERTSPATSGWR